MGQLEGVDKGCLQNASEYIRKPDGIIGIGAQSSRDHFVIGRRPWQTSSGSGRSCRIQMATSGCDPVLGRGPSGA